jgi:hypothetical protein
MVSRTVSRGKSTSLCITYAASRRYEGPLQLAPPPPSVHQVQAHAQTRGHTEYRSKPFTAISPVAGVPALRSARTSSSVLLPHPMTEEGGKRGETVGQPAVDAFWGSR